MRERLRLLLAACFYYSGLVALALWWQRRSSPRLVILNYHRATGKYLSQQMRYLRQHYRVMHLEDALREFYASQQEGRKRDRRIPLVLTFDDGYLDNYTCGLLLARTLHVPITVFLIPGYIESGECFWWLAGAHLAAHAPVEKVTLEGKGYDLARAEEREALAQAIDSHLRHANSVAERERFLAVVQRALGVALPCRAREGMADGALPLTWQEVHEMESSGLVSFGAHTMHHPVLSYLTDLAELRREVAECRRVLEERLGHSVSIFAYPIGKPEHIGEAGLRAVREADYAYALTTIEEVNTLHSDPYMLYRLPGDVNLHWLVMACELAGLLGILSRLRKKYEQVVGR
jgi:peptidoglycan/xylan/chitin deacetylase (PgdA/CDA1 family)